MCEGAGKRDIMRNTKKRRERERGLESGQQREREKESDSERERESARASAGCETIADLLPAVERVIMHREGRC